MAGRFCAFAQQPARAGAQNLGRASGNPVRHARRDPRGRPRRPGFGLSGRREEWTRVMGFHSYRSYGAWEGFYGAGVTINMALLRSFYATATPISSSWPAP